jgi:hypothetical protein
MRPELRGRRRRVRSSRKPLAGRERCRIDACLPHVEKALANADKATRHEVDGESAEEVKATATSGAARYISPDASVQRDPDRLDADKHLALVDPLE